MEENNSFVCAFDVVSKALLLLIEEEPETQHAYEIKNSSYFYVYCILKITANDELSSWLSNDIVKNSSLWS